VFEKLFKEKKRKKSAIIAGSFFFLVNLGRSGGKKYGPQHLDNPKGQKNTFEKCALK
jgi:hypothetical protein